MERVSIFFLGLLCVAGLLSPLTFMLGMSWNTGRDTGVDDGKTQYSRAVYDMCVYLSGEQEPIPENIPATCNQFSQSLIEAGWYELSSEGYRP